MATDSPAWSWKLMPLRMASLEPGDRYRSLALRAVDSTLLRQVSIQQLFHDVFSQDRLEASALLCGEFPDLLFARAGFASYLYEVPPAPALLQVLLDQIENPVPKILLAEAVRCGL